MANKSGYNTGAMNTAYLLIGGNVGNRFDNIETAVNLLEEQIGKITRRSSLYETGAWGYTSQPDFLNQVVIVDTALHAAKCMRQILGIENQMGRVRTGKNAPRIIDIDILFFNDDIINEPGIIIPHPEIQNRKFVLIPVNELSPDLVHPVLHKTIGNLLITCTDPLPVKLLSHP